MKIDTRTSHLFELAAMVTRGNLAATANAVDCIEKAGGVPGDIFIEMLRQHCQGDWGDVCPEDQEVNNQALVYKDRLLSSYEYAGVKFWLITDAGWQTTTLLLPEDY